MKLPSLPPPSERLRNIADIFSGRRAARVRGTVMLTAIGWKPNDSYELKPREQWHNEKVPEWTKVK